MDQKEKREKRQIIGQFIDISHERFKPFEINKLFDLVQHYKEYNGTSKTHHSTRYDYSSEGYYTRKTEATYTFHGDENGIHISKHSEYRDDDGESDSYDEAFTTGREILSVLEKIFGKK